MTVMTVIVLNISDNINSRISTLTGMSKEQAKALAALNRKIELEKQPLKDVLKSIHQLRKLIDNAQNASIYVDVANGERLISVDCDLALGYKRSWSAWNETCEGDAHIITMKKIPDEPARKNTKTMSLSCCTASFSTHIIQKSH
jgi:hypothetical protein